jgi:hypothetical protein
MMSKLVLLSARLPFDFFLKKLKLFCLMKQQLKETNAFALLMMGAEAFAEWAFLGNIE